MSYLNFQNSSGARFYDSVFPSCQGISSPDWKFKVYPRSMFWLNTEYEEEYTLHMSSTDDSDTREVRRL